MFVSFCSEIFVKSLLLAEYAATIGLTIQALSNSCFDSLFPPQSEIMIEKPGIEKPGILQALLLNFIVSLIFAVQKARGKKFETVLVGKCRCLPYAYFLANRAAIILSKSDCA